MALEGRTATGPGRIACGLRRMLQTVLPHIGDWEWYRTKCVREYEMELDEIFKAFGDRLAEIELLRRAGKDVAARESKKYLELAQEAERHPDQALLYSSAHTMHFYDAQTGETAVYGSRKLSVEARVRLVGEKKNREYCWLLVEAYEEFEDYIERAYAFLGKQNPEAWPLEDFGNVRFSELESKDFGWYLETVKRKHRQRPKEILNRLRAVYLDLEAVERVNPVGREPANRARTN